MRKEEKLNQEEHREHQESELQFSGSKFVAEVVRLRTVWHKSPELSRARLRNLLRKCPSFVFFVLIVIHSACLCVFAPWRE
jgi:hypothetical protein